MRNIMIFILGLLLFSACSEQQKKDQFEQHDMAELGTKYTCSMHPQIVQDKPGTCPICGMTLAEVSSVGQSNDLMLNETQMRLANITTQRVSKKPVGEAVIINGTLTVDEELSNAISSRSAGRIEKLFVKETGQAVVKGQPLYVLYSEVLLTLQQEYLLAKDQYELMGKTEKRYKTFLDASIKKLLRYGIAQEQIDRLDRSSVKPSVTFLSPVSGIITKIEATEGQYVSEGSLLYNVEDISSLWVEAELYPNEAAFVRLGDKISVNVTGYESTPVEAEITFLSPEFKSGTQILIMRSSIENPGMKFKPGQQVQATFTRSSREGIAIPINAVIRDGKGSHVYILSGRNTFQPQPVKVGLEGFDNVEIIDGLSEGDTVAVTGAYLLYSELVLKKGYNINTSNINTSTHIKHEN